MARCMVPYQQKVLMLDMVLGSLEGHIEAVADLGQEYLRVVLQLE